MRELFYELLFACLFCLLVFLEGLSLFFNSSANLLFVFLFGKSRKQKMDLTLLQIHSTLSEMHRRGLKNLGSAPCVFEQDFTNRIMAWAVFSFPQEINPL